MRFPSIPPPDAAALAAARAHQDQLTKPPGSLGRLEELALKLAALTGRQRPSVSRKAVLVLAADHGVCEEGVSAYPPEVTGQMALNFLRGGAAVNVLARQAGARLVIVNIGIRAPLFVLGIQDREEDPLLRLVDAPIAFGTANIARGPAMTLSQVEGAIGLGLFVVETEVGRGLDLVAAGDMGIGNTTASAAVIAALIGAPAREVVGRGTGVDDEGLARKVRVVEQALSVNRPDPAEPLEVLRRVGGLEIAGLAGVIVGAAAHRVPVVLDGFISGAAALAAAALVPEVKPYLIASHRSAERGHALVLEALGLEPLLDLRLRLGEGSGAALAFHLVEAAARLQCEMATFGQAGVSDKK